ncbi:MAG: 4-hydroxybenzoate octaprenyltransferase [Alphaproteobacteria bacterium]|nr:4-hydroxybenzoate octaprenyltransferase [Alphaproteobacteria bacterium]
MGKLWLERLSMFDPYLKLMRLHRPVGAFLLLLPCLWGLSLGNTSPSFHYIVLFVLGAFLMRGAGCVINDLADIDIDRKVERTKIRPLASQTLTRLNAIIFLGLLLLPSLLILLQFPLRVIYWGMGSLILVGFYPFMKRITYWPQLFLGFTFNYGVLLGYLTYHEELSVSCLCLYIAGIFWTLGYDTIYAHQDKKDDALIGVKSTALLFKEKTPYFLLVVYTMAIGLILIAGYLESRNYVFYMLINVALLQLIWQITTLELNNGQDCQKKFESNVIFGLIVFFAFYLS